MKYREEQSIEEEFIQLEANWVEKRNNFETKQTALLDQLSTLKTAYESPYRGRTLVTENRLVLQEYTPSDKHAIVTMIGSSSHVHCYWMGAVSMIQSLREAQTRVPNIIVMVRNPILIPEVAYDAFKRLGAELILIENLPLDELNVEIPGTWGMYFFTKKKKRILTISRQ